MGRANRNKLTKKGHRTLLKRLAAAMREKQKAKKMSQDPVAGSTEIQQVTVKNEDSEFKHIKEEIDTVLETEEIEETIESGDDIKNDYESVSDPPCETQNNEELVVKRQLCRGCHSDGVFWSLQTTTEGDTYEDLLQIYFNVQLCQVSRDEEALSGICALCAARLREARAFSAQVGAAEERFTRFYKENRVRVLANEEVIKEAPKIFNQVLVNEEDIKKEVPETLNEEEPKWDSNGKKVKMKRLVKKLKHLTDIDDASDKIRATALKRYSTPAYRLTPSDYERVGDALKCTRCEKLFNSTCTLRYHIKILHMNIGRYTCKLCAKTFRTIVPFIKHKLDEHSIDDRIKCNACDRIFNSRKQLVKHKDSFHMLGVKHPCPHCDYECFSVEALNKHKFKHKSVKDFQCKYCSKAFLRKSNLVLHEKIHTGDKRKICNECGQAFVQKASLNYHMAKYHPEVKF